MPLILAAGKPLKCGSKSGPVTHSVVHQRRQRHHRALARARVQAREILGALAELRLRLQNDEPRAAELIELAHVDRPELRLDRGVDVLNRHAQQLGFLAVHVTRNCCVEARKVVRSPRQLGPLPRLGDDLLRHLIQPRRIARRRVLHPELEPARRSDARDRRRRERCHDRLP